MKLLKTLTLGLLAAASAGVASAQTTVHIVGSTAFRSPATAAIIDYLSTGGATVYAGYTGSSLLGAGAAIFANGTIGTGGSATTIIETYWTGSLAGAVDVAIGNNTGKYLDPSQLSTTDINGVNNVSNNPLYAVGTNPYGGGYPITDSPTTVTAQPDAAFSDAFKATIATDLTGAIVSNTVGATGTYSSVAQLATAINGLHPAGTGTDTTSDVVGVVPFVFAVGNVSNGTGTYTNIGQNTAKQLIGTGYIPDSFITGGAANGNYFYLTGRNEDSGTRIDSFAEAQYNLTNAPKQYEVGGYNGVTNTVLWPGLSSLNTEPTIKWAAAGHSGYASGSNVAAALAVAESGTVTFPTAVAGTTNALFLSYLGITDAEGLAGGLSTTFATGAHALTYNGVTFSPAAVENGQYSLWGYEHLYRLTSDANASIIDGIADDVYNSTADINNQGYHYDASPTTYLPGAGIKISDMQVSRSAEGLPIIP